MDLLAAAILLDVKRIDKLSAFGGNRHKKAQCPPFRSRAGRHSCIVIKSYRGYRTGIVESDIFAITADGRQSELGSGKHNSSAICRNRRKRAITVKRPNPVIRPLTYRRGSGRLENRQFLRHLLPFDQEFLRAVINRHIFIYRHHNPSISIPGFRGNGVEWVFWLRILYDAPRTA